MTCPTFFPKSLQARKRPPPPCHLSFFFSFFFFFLGSNTSKWCDLRVQHNILDHISIEFRSLIVLEFKGGLKRQVLYCSGASVNYLTVDSWCTCRKEHLQESQSKWRSVCFCVCVCVCVLFFCCFFFCWDCDWNRKCTSLCQKGDKQAEEKVSTKDRIVDVWMLSLIHIWRCRRLLRCRSRWSPYH